MYFVNLKKSHEVTETGFDPSSLNKIPKTWQHFRVIMYTLLYYYE